MSQSFTLGWWHRPNIVPTLTFCHFQLCASFPHTCIGPVLAQRWANVVSLTNFHTKTTWHAYVGPMLGKLNAFNIKHNQTMFLKTSHRCTLAQRWVNVVFWTNFYPKPKWQAYVGPMLAQRNAPNATRSCWNKSLMYIGPTLGQRSIINKFYPKPNWQVYISPMLDQRNAPNATQSC